MICPSCSAETPETADSCAACGKSVSSLPKGTLLNNRYEIQELLGRGGMGTVHSAHDCLLDETVAIKVLRANFGSTPEIAHRFRSEIKLARKVRHPNVCAIHEYGEDNGIRYISMEFVSGFDLRRIIREQGGLPRERGFDVVLQILAGLQAVHDVGIIHRDLKTPNIMIDDGGKVRLMDFGMAKQRGSSEAGFATMVGQVFGTPEFMSPEQAKGERADFPSDIYAAGVVLYEIFVGDVPFKGPSMVIMQKHVREAPPLDGEPARKIPPGLIPVIQKAMAKTPSDRYATAQGMASAVRQVRLGAPLPEAADRDNESDLASLVATIPPTAASSIASIAMAAAAASDSDIFAGLGVPVSEGNGSAAKERIAALVQALESPDTAIRWRAAWMLGECGPSAREATSALVETGQNDPDFWVGEAAKVALKKISGTLEPPPERRQRGPREGTPPVPPAVQCLIDKMRSPASRWMAIVALGEMGAEARAAVPQLVEALDDRDAPIRWDAAKALGKIGPAAGPAAPSLAAVVNDRSDSVARQYAIGALGRIGPNAGVAVPSLIRALKDHTAGIDAKAAEALVQIGGAAVPALIEVMKDGDAEVRSRAATALTEIAAGQGSKTGQAAGLA